VGRGTRALRNRQMQGWIMGLVAMTGRAHSGGDGEEVGE
jgi:hypothetical protein